MWTRLKRLFADKVSDGVRDLEFSALYDNLGGFYPAGSEDNFRKALTHVSYSSAKGGNFEQLEFLGDAMLNAVVAELLFIHFPEKREGELTKMRAWMVSRRQLNHIAREMGIGDFIFHGMDKRRVKDARHMEGNVLEALIGAYYLDGGIEVIKAIAMKWLFAPDMMEQALEGSKDPISVLYEWSHKKRKRLHFEHLNQNMANPQSFLVNLKLDEQVMAKGEGRSKKEAERDAAQKAVSHLRL